MTPHLYTDRHTHTQTYIQRHRQTDRLSVNSSRLSRHDDSPPVHTDRQTHIHTETQTYMKETVH